MTAYADRTDADTYFAEHLHAEVWTRIPTNPDGDTVKDKALAHATRIIDRLNFLGTKTDPAQGNEFPRDPDTTVPDDIIYATCELALALLDGNDPEIDFRNLNMATQEIGKLKTTYDLRDPPLHIVAGIPSIEAWRYLQPYLRSPWEMQLVRV
jgi:hypothetical protein